MQRFPKARIYSMKNKDLAIETDLLKFDYSEKGADRPIHGDC